MGSWRGQHPASFHSARIAVALMCRFAGRQNVVRAARFALNEARLDVGGGMQTNGEVALQGWALDTVPKGQRVNVFDVGANVGAWSLAFLENARRRGLQDSLELHAFEPSAHTWGRLAEALGDSAAAIQKLALSDAVGAATLYVVGPAAGTNSLHQQPGLENGATETVPTTTLDAYAREADINRIDILKIDTEGHDVAVLRGAEGMLSEGRITVTQFEYNRTWISARHYLRDAFHLLGPLGYRVGKVTPKGIEFYPSWDSDLETFVQGNYVACTREVAERLPQVSWWKTNAYDALRDTPV